MIKIFFLLFISGMFALASCGGSQVKNEAASKDSAAAAASASKAEDMLKMSAGDTITKVSADTTKKK